MISEETQILEFDAARDDRKTALGFLLATEGWELERGPRPADGMEKKSRNVLVGYAKGQGPRTHRVMATLGK